MYDLDFLIKFALDQREWVRKLFRTQQGHLPTAENKFQLLRYNNDATATHIGQKSVLVSQTSKKTKKQ